MRIRFLLGPAGSGKTHRCLDEIRSELLRDPFGAPLLLLAPKQSTFLLERALLEDERLPGWSRLQILSFDRLARQVLGEEAPVDLLNEEGRLMVLRAMLRERHADLRVFRSTARLTGFAQELSATLRELQSYQIGPSRLEDLERRVTEVPPLAGKLHDLAVLLRAYRDRLAARNVVDVDRLNELAAEALRRPDAFYQLEAVWLDGFAEMTPQEIDLLAAIVARARRSTVAFCVDRDYRDDAAWLSTWAVVSQTVRRCHARLSALTDASVEVEVLNEGSPSGRFGREPALAHLAAAWSAPCPAGGRAADGAPEAIRLVACRDTEQEAVVAAREIRRHVQNGGRYREAAILLRSLEADAPIWRRVLLRYEIPCFIDRRESLAHHPLAELTRGALRLAAFDWPPDDWFALLKTGLTPVPAQQVDAWENLALAQGWDGAFWRRTPEDPPTELTEARRLLEHSVVPFRRFVDTVGVEPSARTLVAALRRLWEELDVQSRLDTWVGLGDSESGPDSPAVSAMAALHRAAWEQLVDWLDNLEMGFGEERMALSDWLPVIEAGLSALTAGVIPPSQDQVVVGAIDRSRQPELKLAIVAGLNEGVFPAQPGLGGLLSETDRDRLAQVGAVLGPDRRRRSGHERFYGYIACTRSGGRLVLTWSRQDARGRPLNASPFVAQIRGLFPSLCLDDDTREAIPTDAPPAMLAERAVHPNEILPWLLARPEATPIDGLAGDAVRRAWLRGCRSDRAREQLAPAAVRGLYGAAPELTVSALENLAACPFRFFVEHGLQGRERAQLEADPRHTGTLAHRILARFHEETTCDGRRWRDLSPEEARTTLARVAREPIATAIPEWFAGGPKARWDADRLVVGLAELVATLVVWNRSYDFDPIRAELPFGGAASLPAWSPDPENPSSLRLRGTVDRVDIGLTPDGGVRFTVMDYKLRPPRYDDLRAAAGVDLQLPAYVLALTELLPRLGLPGGKRVEPAGMFYIGLRGRPRGSTSRRDLPSPEEARRGIYVHRGRFRSDAADALDRTHALGPSGQFALARNKDGSLRRSGDARDAAEWNELLRRVRETLVRLQALLQSGVVAPSPFRHRGQTACDGCPSREICRFDPWLQPFRALG